jgi:hypothetical protein
MVSIGARHTPSVLVNVYEIRDRVGSHSETRVLAECFTAKHQAMKRRHQDSEPCFPSAYSSTICTLASICGIPALLEEIQYSCDVLKQVQLEAWHVPNLHVLRVFSSLSREQRNTADDFLKIDQSLFYSCCSATLQSSEERDCQERVHEDQCIRTSRIVLQDVQAARPSVVECTTRPSESPAVLHQRSEQSGHHAESL